MSSSSKKKKSFKQGSLFSFFSKKPTSTNAAAAAASSSSSVASAAKGNSTGNNPARKDQSNHDSTGTTATNSNDRKTNSSTSPKPKVLRSSLTLLEKIKVGKTKIKVFWQEDRQYYACDVLDRRSGTTTFRLRYDDGENEWTDLATQTFKILYDDEDDDEDEDVTVGNKKVGGRNTGGSTKRGRQQLDDDDSDDDGENEWKDEGEEADGEDDESFSADDEEEEDEDQWMDTDEEEEESLDERKKPPKKKKKFTKASVKVTRYNVIPDDVDNDVDMTPSSKSRTSQASSSRNVSNPTSTVVGGRHSTPLQQFSYSANSRNVTAEKEPRRSSKTTPSASFVSSSSSMEDVEQGTARRSTGQNNPPMFTKGALNVAGSHVHNHLPFVQNPRDKNGRRPGDPDYDGRTLKVNPRQWENVTGGKMTAAVEQWWDLKSQYFDTILFFKTGKFYELYHMDSDIGVQVLGLKYMNGHVAHAGFPEISYGSMADKLVRRGYKVARVEQTETPDQLAQRKKAVKGRGKTPKAVNREICSIMTLGTRTFCALDDCKMFLESNGEGESGGKSDGIGGCGPLLAISEIVFDNDTRFDGQDGSGLDDEQDSVMPHCEYGITMIDAIRGVVTVGQFADDVLRTRMHTLLCSFSPSEILIKGGDGTSKELKSMIDSYQSSIRAPCRIETIGVNESFPASTALDPNHRRFLQRPSPSIRPWDAQETLDELHRKKYFPRSSRQSEKDTGISRWPAVLRAVVEGGADLCMSSFGATLFYLQRNLIDQEILSMGIIKAYIPRVTPAIDQQRPQHSSNDRTMPSSTQWYSQQDGHDGQDTGSLEGQSDGNPLFEIPRSSQVDADATERAFNPEDDITSMQMDGTTLHNLEILTNSIDFKQNGSLWSKINYTKSPHGARMLRAWLCRPLFRKADIERRADAVSCLATGSGSLALKEARQHVFAKLGDLERLLSRIHSVGYGVSVSKEDDATMENAGCHPNDRAVLYEGPIYTKRKVSDFSKALNGLKEASQIPEIFANVDLEQSSLLYKMVRLVQDGGLFPDMTESLDWYFENFDCEEAAKGSYEPVRGTDPLYDQACDTVARVKEDLDHYKETMIQHLSPRSLARSSWKYANIKPDSKDKYLIELPANVAVPDFFIMKGKRGSGAKQINKYSTSDVVALVHELEQAIDIQQARKAKGMQIIFAKFDSQRSLWSSAAHATAILDAIGSLALVAGHPGYCRPTILDCPLNQQPSINIVQGRHPCISNVDFVANDLSLGGRKSSDDETDTSERLLLLSGPNMGGKSTLLRQTCLIAILAQIGSYVPAESCSLTPIDCIFTRLGASDRILLGQSTFFVELAETAAALRGASRRSLVIMDELGRGTSTFDGTAIAGATVNHLVERSQCLSLFATHYHSLLDSFEGSKDVRLGHMQCIVQDDDDEDSSAKGNVVFLYTLGPGQCPKSFGLNVARLAGLPSAVVENAKVFSETFEQEMAAKNLAPTDDSNAILNDVIRSVEDGDDGRLTDLWKSLSRP